MPKKGKGPTALPEPDKKSSAMFDGDYMSKYQELFDAILEQGSELGHIEGIHIGDVSKNADYFFDPEAVLPFVKFFLNRFFSADTQGIDKLLKHQALRHNQMKALRSSKLEYNQNIINWFKTIGWNQLNHKTPHFKETLDAIQGYLKTIIKNLSDEAQVLCVKIEQILQEMRVNLDPTTSEELKKLKFQLNLFLTKIETQSLRYNKENEIDDGSPALCLSFLLVNLGEREKQCLVSMSSPELNQGIYLAIKTFITCFNAENEARGLDGFVPFKLLAPSSDNFDRLVEAVNASSGGLGRKNISKKCAEKPLASSLMKFFYTHPMELKGESLCNIQFYPFKEGLKYGQGTVVKAPLESSHLIKLDSGLYVPSIPCCQDCKLMKEPVIKLWRVAKQKGDLKNKGQVLEMQSELQSFELHETPPIKKPFFDGRRAIAKDVITSPAKESPLKRKQTEDSRDRVKRFALDYFPRKSEVLFSFNKPPSEALPLGPSGVSFDP